MTMKEEKRNYRLRYQYEMVMLLTGKSKEAIRKYMYRHEIKNTTEGFVTYLIYFLRNHRIDYLEVQEDFKNLTKKHNKKIGKEIYKLKKIYNANL